MNEAKTAVVLAALQKKAQPLFKKLPEKITTKQQYEDAASNMKAIKALVKEAEKEKKQLIDPLNVVIKRIREHFRPFENKAAEAEAKLKSQMSSYLLESEKKAKAIEQKLEDGKIKKVATAVKKQNEILVTTNIRKVWTAVCVDASKTPRKFLVPDEAAIKAALKNGEKVDGWKWEQVDQIVI